MARRPVRRPAVAARPACTLARRAAMRRLGFGRPVPVTVPVVRTRGVLGVGRLSLGPGAPGVRGGPGERLARRSPPWSSGPGAKVADAQLIGCPVRVTIGKRTATEGSADVQVRRGREQRPVAVAEVAATVQAVLSEA